MANFRTIGGGNVSVRYKTIATAAANQTFGQQMTQLKATLDTLTEEEKRRCIFTYGSSKAMFVHYSENSYSYIYTGTAQAQMFTMNFSTLHLYGVSFTASGNNFSDSTSSTNATPMYLMLLCNY